MDEDLTSYRALLIDSEQKAQTEFDKTVLALSGGALGLSLTFVNNFMALGQAHCRSFLVGAWGCWTVSLAVVLGSHYFAVLAFRHARRQTDAGKAHEGRPGGLYDGIVGALNVAGGIAFLLGVVAITWFVVINVR